MRLKRIWSPSNALRRSASAHSSSPRRRLSLARTPRRSGGTRRGWWPDIFPTRRLFIRGGVGGCPKASAGSTTRAAPRFCSAFGARRTSAGSWMRCEREGRFRSYTILRIFRRRSGPKAASARIRPLSERGGWGPPPRARLPHTLGVHLRSVLRSASGFFPQGLTAPAQASHDGGCCVRMTPPGCCHFCQARPRPPSACDKRHFWRVTNATSPESMPGYGKGVQKIVRSEQAEQGNTLPAEASSASVGGVLAPPVQQLFG